MGGNAMKIRLMKADDFDAVLAIDKKVLKISRQDYYELRFEKLVQSKDYVPVSLVAEDENGTVVGFIMGELYIGEYGISEERATLDTIGVDPDHQRKGIGERLIKEFVDHLRSLGIKKINTLVEWDDSNLVSFFSLNHFTPSKTIYLERNV